MLNTHVPLRCSGQPVDEDQEFGGIEVEEDLGLSEIVFEWNWSRGGGDWVGLQLEGDCVY